MSAKRDKYIKRLEKEISKPIELARFSGSLSDISSKDFKEFIKQDNSIAYYSIDADNDYYDGYNGHFVIIGYRYETKEELEARKSEWLKDFDKRNIFNKEESKNRAKQRKEEELKTYLKLKEKYENI